MLTIVVPETELFDEATQQFITYEAKTLQLEHSLVSLSKWESKWCKPFLTNEEKTFEETLDYIKCMTITQNVKPDVYLRLSKENIEQINAYIEAPMTASYVYEDPRSRGRINNEQVTAELIYYWMISLQIPVEFQKWHLNRLIMLIKVINHKNQPPKKMSKRDIMSRNAALNAARRQKLNTKG